MRENIYLTNTNNYKVITEDSETIERNTEPQEHVFVGFGRSVKDRDAGEGTGGR